MNAVDQAGLSLTYTVKVRGTIAPAGVPLVLESQPVTLAPAELYAMMYRLRLTHPRMNWEALHTDEVNT